MFGLNQIVPRQMVKFVPEQYKNRPYREIKTGDVFTIESVVISCYKKTKKVIADDGGVTWQPVLYKSGEPVLGESVYMAIDDGSFTRIDGENAFMQIAQTVGYVQTEPGYFEFKMNDKVRAITVKEQAYRKDISGKVVTIDVDKIAFENVE